MFQYEQWAVVHSLWPELIKSWNQSRGAAKTKRSRPLRAWFGGQLIALGRRLQQIEAAPVLDGQQQTI